MDKVTQFSKYAAIKMFLSLELSCLGRGISTYGNGMLSEITFEGHLYGVPKGRRGVVNLKFLVAPFADSISLLLKQSVKDSFDGFWLKNTLNFWKADENIALHGTKLLLSVY